MATFARRLRRQPRDGKDGLEIMALVELAKKRGGPSFGFTLYRYIKHHRSPEGNRYESIHLNARTPEEALRRFWPFEESGREFPGFASDRWEEATDWLHSVAIGSRFPMGAWVRVGRATRSQQYQKKNLKRPVSDLPESETPLQMLERQRNELTERIDLLQHPKHNSRLISRGNGKELARLSVMLAGVEEQIVALQGKSAVSMAQQIFDEASQMEATQ